MPRTLSTIPGVAQQTSHERCLTQGAQDGPIQDHKGRCQKIARDWKIAHIAPILKKIGKYKASNNHPVSLTCVPMQMYGTHCGQSGNATSFQEQHPVQPLAWLQIQTLNRNTID